ncbi:MULTISPECIES: hypothetical protein [unclassified Paenibacillus]|nr:hypothetical protein [Paenibacillus sp. FSL R7-277]
MRNTSSRRKPFLRLLYVTMKVVTNESHLQKESDPLARTIPS